MDGLPSGKPSGAQNRKRQKAEAAALGDDVLAPFDPKIAERFAQLGPPPRDPLLLTEWHAEATGIVAWAYATGDIAPGQHARLRGILESVRSGGMVAVKAQERKRQRQIAERVGAVPEINDGLDDFPGQAPKLGTA